MSPSLESVYIQCLYLEATICSNASKQREEYINCSWHLDIMVMETAFMQKPHTYAVPEQIGQKRLSLMSLKTYVESGMKARE